MKFNIKLKKFLVSEKAWNENIGSDKTDPVVFFNSLNYKTRFENDINLENLISYFKELKFFIEKGDISNINSIVKGFIPIVLKKMSVDSSVFNFSLKFFQFFYHQTQKYNALLRIIACFDILSSKLPITVSLDHLCNIQDEQSFIIHKYLSDDSYPIILKCLAVSLCFPSARFISKYQQDYEVPDDLICYPDINEMLEKYYYFNQSDLFFAALLMQYSNSLILSIGLNKEVTLKQMLDFQELLSFGNLTLSSICHAIYLHTTQPSTIHYIQNFFVHFDNECGIELLKEMCILNTTKSFSNLLQVYGTPLINFFFKYVNVENIEADKTLKKEKTHGNNQKFNDFFLNIIKPYHKDLKHLEEVISRLVEFVKDDDDEQKILPFLGALYSVLLRFSLEPLHVIYQIIIENFINISMIFHCFFEMLTLQPFLNKKEITAHIVNIIAFIYDFFNRCKFKSISNELILDTLDCLYYLMHVQFCYSKSKNKNAFFYHDVLFHLQRAMTNIESFFKNEEIAKAFQQFFKVALPMFMVPSASVIGSFINLDLDTIKKIFEYSLFSSKHQFFTAAKNALIKFGYNHFFSQFFLSYYFTIISYLNKKAYDDDNDTEIPSKNGVEIDSSILDSALKLYLILLNELLSQYKEYINDFLTHPIYANLIDFFQKLSISKNKKDAIILIQIFEKALSVYAENGNKVLPDIDINALFSNLPNLIPAAESILSLSILYARNIGRFPWTFNVEDIIYSKAGNFEWFKETLCNEFPDDFSDISIIFNLALSSTYQNTDDIKNIFSNNIPWMDDQESILTDIRKFALKKQPVNIPSYQIIEEEDEEEEVKDDEEEDSEF